jgi:hypothetical protein
LAESTENLQLSLVRPDCTAFLHFASNTRRGALSCAQLQYLIISDETTFIDQIEAHRKESSSLSRSNKNFINYTAVETCTQNVFISHQHCASESIIGHTKPALKLSASIDNWCW